MALDLEELRRAARGGGAGARAPRHRRPRLRPVPASVPVESDEGWTWRSWLGLLMIGMFLYRCVSADDKGATVDPGEATTAEAAADAGQAVAAPRSGARPRAPTPDYDPPPLLDPEAPSPGPRLVAGDDLQAGARRVPMQAGLLSVVSGGGSQRLQLDGVDLVGPSGAAIRLVHRAKYVDREVVTGLSGCRSTGEACAPDRPFFVLMRTGLPTRVLQAQGISVTPGFGTVSADDTGVIVDIGIDRGTQWRATLTARDGIHVDSRAARMRALDDAQCAQVSLALRECSFADAASCAIPGASAARIGAARRNALTSLFNGTTGFNERGFLALCSDACSSRVPPSAGRVFAEVCSGADPTQWAAPALPWLPGARMPEVDGGKALPTGMTPVEAARTGAAPVETAASIDFERSPAAEAFYPSAAQRAGIEGAVVVGVCIDDSGRMVGAPEVRRGSGHEVLDQAALRWVTFARFNPALRDGSPVAACVTVPVRYALQR